MAPRGTTRVPTEDSVDELEPMADGDEGGFAVAEPGAGIVVEFSWRNGLICVLTMLVVLLVGVVIGESQGVYVPGREPAAPAPSVSPGPVVGPGGNGNGDQGNNAGNGGSAGGNPSPTPSPKPALFTAERAAASRLAATKFIDMLEGYYGEYKHILLQGWSVDPTSSAFSEGSAYLVNLFARALVSDEQKKFVIGTIGSSVAAGHDNCNYDSYERQLQRNFAGVLQEAGLELEVQNAGEGGGCGDTHENQVFCVTQNIAPWADIVHYSWTYFEGRDGAPKEHEQLIRWAQMMTRQPPVHIFNTGGTMAGCLASRSNVQIQSAYGKYGFNALCLEGALFHGGLYGGKKWGAVGDGYHNTTRYGEAEPDKERRNSLGVVFRNWHPGPLGFQMIADAFAYVYAKSMVQAIDAIEEQRRQGADPRLVWKQERVPRLTSDLPKPMFCDPAICAVDDPPGCLNFELPTYGWHGASVAGPDDKLSPLANEKQAWTIWKGEGSNNLIPRFERRKYAGDAVVSCEHLDACAGISASSPDQGWVVFKLPKMNAGTVILCGCCGKSVAESMFIKNEGLEIQFDGKLLDKSKFDVFPNAKCARILKTFPKDMRDSGGHVYMGLRIKPGTQNPSGVKISHVITV